MERDPQNLEFGIITLSKKNTEWNIIKFISLLIIKNAIIKLFRYKFMG